MKSQTKSQTQRALTIASLLLAALAYRGLLFWDSGRDLDPTDEGWFFRPSETSLHILFALAAALVWRRWSVLRGAAQGAGSPGAALLPLLAATALYLWGHFADAPDLVLASLLALALGVALLGWGAPLARELVLPLLVLLFAIPIPAALTNALFHTLQLWTARDAAFLLSLAGMPLFREANAIYGAHAQFMVIDTCAGLRFMEVLTLLAVVYAGWSRGSRLRTLLRVALAPPIAYFFNLLRVCLLITHPTSELSSMHSVQGWVVFLAAVTCFVYVDRLLLGRLPGCAPPPAGSTPPPSALDARARNAGRWLPALVVLIAALLGASIWISPWQIPQESRFKPIALPMEIDGWKMGRSLPSDLPYLGTVRFSTSVHRPYRRDAEEIYLFVASDDRTDRGRSYLTPKNAFVDGGWEVEEQRTVALGPNAQPAVSVLAHSRERRILSFSWYSHTGTLGTEVLRALLALDQSPLRRAQPGRLIRLATPVSHGSAGRDAAEARLRAFAAALEAALASPRAVEKQREPEARAKSGIRDAH